MAPPLRVAARVIALDPDDRVLLVYYAENGGFWATPGGRVEDGEDDRAGALRELAEELGVDAARVDLREQVAERSQDHEVGDQLVRQVECYFLAYLNADDLDPARATQPDTIRAVRWWTIAELTTTTETVYPLGLADLVTNIQTTGAPSRPVVLR
jgi:ADP-ribose pyrophosphatase YjhB (NUDIX family)